MMTLPPDLINAYDELYINNTERFPLSFFSKQYPERSHQRALELFRYAITTRLHWDKYEIRDHLTMDVVKKLKLNSILEYIKFPVGFNPSTSLFFIAWCLYPETKNKSIVDVELETYEHFLSGKIMKMPKMYFDGMEGLNRAYHCLTYAINKFKPVIDGDYFCLYEFFSSVNAISFLSDIKLIKVVNAFGISPLDFLHYSLPVAQRNNLYYNYFSFMLQYNSHHSKNSQSAVNSANDINEDESDEESEED